MHLYIHDSTVIAATPKPPEAAKPVTRRATVMTAGTRTGLNMTKSGIECNNRASQGQTGEE